MKTRLARNLLKFTAAFLALAIAAFAIAWFQFRSPLKPDFLSAPSSNGYELLLAAAAQLQVEDPSAVTNYASFLQQHEQMFADLDAALAHPAEAPARWYDLQGISVTELVSLRNLGKTLETKGKYFGQERRWREAAEPQLDTIRLGQAVEHGPLFNLLIGSALEIRALATLRNLLPNLAASELTELARVVQELNQERLPFAEVLRRERYFMAVTSTNVIQNLRERFSRSFRRTVSDSEERYLDTAAKTEILAATMAALAYTSQHKKPPASLADLVPEYLPTPPLDPYTHTPLRGQFSATNLLVYSTGPNRQDDATAADDITLDDQDAAGARIMTEAMSKMF